MSTSWYDGYAVCPYYISDDRKCKIECTGVSDDSRINWKFKTHAGYKIQIETFCCRKYRNCEVYQMLHEIYEGE